jgi:hypothetical protein
MSDESHLTRAAHEAAKANCVAINNTKLVASLDSLGFHSDCSPAENITTGKTVREFMVKPRSFDPVFAGLDISIARAWEASTLDAMHPLSVAMRAQHNYDRIIDMHHGAVMNLRSTALLDPLKPERGGQATLYKRATQPDPRSHFSAETFTLTNLALVAALAAVGIPVLSFEGVEGQRRYTLPRFGYALARADGTTYLEQGDNALFAVQPTSTDPWALAIAEIDPRHPVAIGYNAIRSRIRLRELLRKKAPHLHIQEAGLQALVTANHTGRVADQLAKRFGAPVL